jgi:hypothetical protein
VSTSQLLTAPEYTSGFESGGSAICAWYTVIDVGIIAVKIYHDVIENDGKEK